jgi:hypothetical protein
LGIGGGFEGQRQRTHQLILTFVYSRSIFYFIHFFILKEHWKRVKIQLKSILGYFCTLDALGYSEKQLDVLFMTLGTMIATLSSDPGEHQLRYINCRFFKIHFRLLFSFQRTCYQVAVDFNLFPKIREIVSNFFTKVGSRAK